MVIRYFSLGAMKNYNVMLGHPYMLRNNIIWICKGEDAGVEEVVLYRWSSPGGLDHRYRTTSINMKELRLRLWNITVLSITLFQRKVQNKNHDDRACLWCWTHNRYPISRPCGLNMRCRLWVRWNNELWGYNCLLYLVREAGYTLPRPQLVIAVHIDELLQERRNSSELIFLVLTHRYFISK